VRIVVATALAALVATPLNLAIEALARQAFAVSSEFEPFQGTVGPYTVGGVVLAAATFAVVRRFARDVTWAYVRIAIVALVLSWIPDVALLVLRDPGATVPAVGSLMVMHALTAVIVVGLMLRLAR
jgi:hypothetical protein